MKAFKLVAISAGDVTYVIFQECVCIDEVRQPVTRANCWAGNFCVSRNDKSQLFMEGIFAVHSYCI